MQVAEFNPNPTWPGGYFEVLEEVGVAEKYRKFYAYWVRQFFNRYLGSKRRRDLGRIEVAQFLEELRKNERFEDWQVQQAHDALHVYYEQFRGICLTAVKEKEQPGCSKARKVRQTERPRRTTRGRPIRDRSPPDIPSPADIECATHIPPPKRSSKHTHTDWPKLEHAVKAKLRLEHYALRTEKTYKHWIKRFVAYHNWRKPSTIGAPEILQYLSHLAINENVAASTQNQALNSIVFLYRKVLR